MKKTFDASLLASARSAARRSVFNLVAPAPGADANKPWYEIRNAKDDSADLYIMDEIGYWGVTASDFARDIKDVKATTLNLYVNSPGGSVFDGLSIYGSLIKWAENNKAKIIAHVDGWAASIASVIIMAADEIRIAEAAMIMVHEPSSIVWGTAKEMRKEADVLDSIEEAIIDVYEARTSGDRDQIAEWVSAETWFKGQEAVDAGFAHVLVGNKKKDDDGKSNSAYSTRMNADFIAEIYPNLPSDVREALTTQPAASEEKELPKTIREFKNFLRESGFSNKQADAIAGHGFKDKSEVRDEPAIVEEPTTQDRRDDAEKRDVLAAIKAAALTASVVNAAYSHK